MAEYRFTLFVAGNGPNATGVEANVRALMEAHIGDDYVLEVVDVLASPERAEEHSIIATPTLIKADPPPTIRLIGDMSNTSRVLSILGLPVS